MKRSPLRRRTPLRPMSDRRSAEAQARRECRAEVIRRDRGCVGPDRGLDGRCSGPLDVHEILTRARGGSSLDPANCVALCRSHHDWVTEHPVEAHALGLVRWSWEGAA